jgi:catechol 2,3-dioxygenase-like lactoylglutathione lyase family enzyme
MSTIFRYLVADVDAAVLFYTKHLGFSLEESWGPPFASLKRGNLSLWLSGPASSAARALDSGEIPEPGGWNRLVVAVDDVKAAAENLRAANVTFRSDITTGPGGTQILIEDPSGNPIELFQPQTTR